MVWGLKWFFKGRAFCLGLDAALLLLCCFLAHHFMIRGPCVSGLRYTSPGHALRLILKASPVLRACQPNALASEVQPSVERFRSRHSVGEILSQPLKARKNELVSSKPSKKATSGSSTARCFK